MNIDYSKLKDRIVEQAYFNAHVLNTEQKNKLIADKLERAQATFKAIKASPAWRTDR